MPLGSALSKLVGQGRRVTLPDGQELVVKPFTLGEFDEMDALEPGNLTPTQYMSLRLYMVLRHVPGYETSSYDEWRTTLDGAAYAALRPLADAIEVVNQPFRHRQPAGEGSRPAAPHAG